MTKTTLALATLFLLGCGSNRPGGECVGADCPGGPVCGNDDRETGEECDTTDLGGTRCAGVGFDGGQLLCGDLCTFDTAGCCMNGCEASGASRCSGTRVESCTNGGNGCLAWVTVTDCALSAGTCVESGAAECTGSGCSDTCPEADDTRCNGVDTVELCSLGADGCRAWVLAGDCAASDRVCDDSGALAVCRLACTDGCTNAYDTRCNGSAVESCDYGADGCLAWTEVVDCADTTQLCDEGTGTPRCADTCTDGCTPAGVTRCLGDLLQTCNTQPSGCRGWLSTTDCTADGRLCEVAPAPAACLLPASSVRVHFDTGYGNRITLRGAAAGLSWDAGMDCVWGEGNVWTCDVPGLVIGDPIKPLWNDEVWAKGTNYQVVEAGPIDIYPLFWGNVGRIDTWDQYYSSTLDNARTVKVYLPVSYDENTTKSYPILIMHDGQNVFDASTSFLGIEWQIDEALNTLTTQGGITEAIVVAPYNAGDQRTYEYTPTVDASVGGGGGGDAYLDFLLDELVPDVRAAYRTTGDRVGIAGSSFGGVISLYGCWTRPAAFDLCGVFSPALWWDDGFLLGLVEDSTGPKPDLKIYLDSGDSGPGQDGMVATAMMRDLLTAEGFVLGEDLMYVLGVGHEHNEAAWAARAPAALQWLLDDPQRM